MNIKAIIMTAVRLVTLVVVFLLSVAGGYIGFSSRATTSTAAAGLTQVSTARLGNLISTITVVGELDAVQREDLTFSKMSGATRLAQLNVKTGQTVKAGDVIATIDPAPYQQALDQAQSDLQAAEEKLADLKTPATKLEVAKASLAVAKAENTLAQAKKDLSTAQSPDLASLQNAVRDAQDSLTLAEQQQIIAQHDALAKSERDLQYAVDWHQRRINDLQQLVSTGQANLEQKDALAKEQEALGLAQADLARVQANRQLSLQAAAASVAKARATLEDAQEALATAKAGGDKLALAKAKVAVQEAEVALASAQDARATLEQGADAITLAAAQADVDKKRLALADAKAALAAATLTAPFDGTILKVNVTTDNLISANTQIAAIANLKNLQVLASVDETTIRKVAVDQTAQITFDALAGQTLRGKVQSVPLQGALQGNVMVYEVPISLTGAENLPLLVGMTANVKLQVGQAANALLVPAMAVQQVGAGYQVLTPNSEDPQGQPKAVAVEIGLSDGVNTQIVSGLKVGDKVLVQLTTATSSTQNQRNTGIFSFFGGGIRFR
jgi:RND family efflux transporter MFP subunit